MNFLITIILSITITALSLFGAYNFLPLSTLEFLNKQETKLGVSLTTIAGTDTISSSRTTINNNFTSLNGKMESATTSVQSITTAPNLATVGTIGTGVWNGTLISGAFGGTGSSTISANRVLLGNGSSGLTIATSTGSVGQFLTSAGEGKQPFWQSASVNLGDNYPWTGTHLFSQQINASSSLLVNGGATIMGTTTVGGLVATSSINATQFSATATTTFNSPIKLVSSNCISDSVGCIRTKYATFATSTGVISTNQTNTITVGFTPKSFQGMVWTDATSDVDVFGSFSQNGTSVMSIGGFDSLAVDYFTSSYIFQRNTANDDLLVTINNITSTGFDLVYSGITGSFTSVQINIQIIGE